jgi:predicted phage terminase large subunit-like protein
MSEKLDAEAVEGFQRLYLWDKFDSPAPTPGFHRIMWREACDESLPRCAWAAPRNFAKSTAITFTFALAAIAFRMRDHIMIVSDAYDQAVLRLKEIQMEWDENEHLRSDFSFSGFIKEKEGEIILSFEDGYKVRVLARGSEQRLRGMLWRGKRPNLILGDDLEFDEIVESAERLKKFKAWFFKQLLPAAAKNSLFRIGGTILAFNSLLMNLMTDSQWRSHLWKAHEDFDDFSNLLWPEHWPEERLRDLRQTFINQGQSDAYSQEVLNTPIARGNAVFDREDLLDIPFGYWRDWESYPEKRPVVFYASVDFAVSKTSSADRTVISIATVDANRYLDIVDVVRGRWDAKEVIEKLFEVSEAYEIDTWFMERGAILKSLGPFLEEEMVKRNRFLNLHLMNPSKDKITRSKSIQARIKAGRVRFDHSAGWWPYAEQEMLHFPRAAHDDFVDTMSQFGLALDEIITPLTEEETEEEAYALELSMNNQQGRNKVTGY